jgi:hypothetical protein
MKHLGFDEPHFGLYGKSEANLYKVIGDKFDVVDDIHFIKAPTFSQAFSWLRKNYGYWCYIKEATKGTCRFYIEKFDEKFFNSDIIDSYEEAELECLEKLIEIVESKKS